MERRNCVEVIEQMLEKIPEDKTELIKDLKWNKNDAKYKPPEETLQWQRTGATLQGHISIPKEDWEFEILSIFSTIPVEEIKEEAKKELMSTN
jgi:hypothetical protein